MWRNITLDIAFVLRITVGGSSLEAYIIRSHRATLESVDLVVLQTSFDAKMQECILQVNVPKRKGRHRQVDWNYRFYQTATASGDDRTTTPLDMDDGMPSTCYIIFVSTDGHNVCICKSRRPIYMWLKFNLRSKLPLNQLSPPFQRAQRQSLTQFRWKIGRRESNEMEELSSN